MRLLVVVDDEDTIIFSMELKRRSGRQAAIKIRACLWLSSGRIPPTLRGSRDGIVTPSYIENPVLALLCRHEPIQNGSHCYRWNREVVSLTGKEASLAVTGEVNRGLGG